ncbi:MAG TPA: FAD binding domain-containing protein, partial [Caulobacteraceae bacterium]
MAVMDFVAPESAEAAAKALAAGGAAARALSGGTDLIVQLRAGRVKPNLIVDLKRIPGAIGVRREAGGFVIGAATPGAMLGEDEALAAAWPGVVEAATLIGSTQVQGRASLGGNLCNASPAADSVPALIAARARCVIVGPDGRREAAVEDIPTGPGATSLSPGEFVLEIRLPPANARAADAYLRSIPRTEMDIAIVGAGVWLALDGAGAIADARIALGAVAPTVVLADAAAVIGAKLDEAALERLDA